MTFFLSFTLDDWVEKKRRIPLSFRGTRIAKNNQEGTGLGGVPRSLLCCGGFFPGSLRWGPAPFVSPLGARPRLRPTISGLPCLPTSKATSRTLQCSLLRSPARFPGSLGSLPVSTLPGRAGATWRARSGGAPPGQARLPGGGCCGRCWIPREGGCLDSERASNAQSPPPAWEPWGVVLNAYPMALKAWKYCSAS